MTAQEGLDALVALSRHYGNAPGFVIAGGGNTSFKTADTLYVKASGAGLATISREGFVSLDRAMLAALANSRLAEDTATREAQFKEAILKARREPERGQRPSVEALLHELLPAKFVVHSHATLVNGLTCCTRGEAIARELFGNEVMWLPYVDPGYVLGRKLKELLTTYKSAGGVPYPKIILMANHGLIVSGDSPEEVKATTEHLMARIRGRIDNDAVPFAQLPGANPGLPAARDAMINIIAPALRALLAEPEAKALRVVTFDDSPLVTAFVGSDAAATLPFAGPLNPDQIVYCNSFPLYVSPPEDADTRTLVEGLRVALGAYQQSYGCQPRVVLVRGVGLFAAGDDYKSAVTARDLYKDAIEILAGAARLGGPTFLSTPQRKFIEDWEVEAYRRQVAKGSANAAGRVAGKIALVTGAAQGFGLEIAQALVAQGATVALADLNAAGAQSAAVALCEAHGKGRAIGLMIDVTRSESIGACVHQLVRTYGGLDVLISNAGVLRAESVMTQSERDFDFVTAVNYKGYFFCVQKVSPILAVQNQARPGRLADIIQINSKSGLAGSNKNAAYAGSKFGGIGLTQSFALELLEHGIKVNALCPGNFFDGPLWSDPESGLFVQYLRAGKVPGAKTIADVRHFYEAKVPMGRGCTAADVMAAIFYVIDQPYETGQALPVTGGQVMLG